LFLRDAVHALHPEFATSLEHNHQEGMTIMKKGKKSQARKATTPAITAATDEKAIALIKASGILNPDAKLDGLLKVAQKFGTATPAAAPRFHVFVFREVVFVKCPF
jgi:hypothetical protein